MLAGTIVPGYADHDVDLEVVSDSLTAPVAVAPSPDQGLFIAEQSGVIHVLDENEQRLAAPLLDLADRLVPLEKGFEERGLLGFVLHPDFATSGRFYVTYNAPLRDGAPANFNNTRIVSEFTANTDRRTTDLATERVLLAVDWPSRKHNGGALAFGPDGYLYIGLGDGGGIHGVGKQVLNDAFNVPLSLRHWDSLAQDKQTLFGKVLRIDVDNGFPGYAIPRENPLVDAPGRDEIYAWGFRNPYRIAFDPDGSGTFYVSATAETLFEAVYAVSEPGNYGWAIREGTHCLDRARPLDPPRDCPESGVDGEPIQMPIIEYPNKSANRPGSALTGGGIGTAVVAARRYRGKGIPAMDGFVVVADWSFDFRHPSGQLFVSRPEGKNRLWPLRLLTRVKSRIIGLSTDASGELLVLTNDELGPFGNSGKVLRLVRNRDHQ